MITQNLINEDQYNKMVKALNEQGINRPSTKEIMIILDLESGLQAQRYKQLYKARHPENYRVPCNGGAISHAIKGERVTGGNTPELDKAMKDAEENSGSI